MQEKIKKYGLLIIVILLLVVSITEGFIVSKLWNPKIENKILLDSYFFYGSDFWIRAHGTWLSDTDLGAPVQSSDILCFKDSMLCSEAIGQISMGMLNVTNELYDIDIWNDKEILTKPKDFLCARYIMRIDLIQEEVTETRTTLSTEGSCSFMGKEPMHLYLGDGFKALEKRK